MPTTNHNHVTDRSALGRRSRSKGKKFELVVRDHIKLAARGEAWVDGLVIRRSAQAERAWNADLIIEGLANTPPWLLQLWLECEHAGTPDPRAKFAQATRDIAHYAARTGRSRLPMVVWRKTGARILHASTDAVTLLRLLELAGRASVTWSSAPCGTLLTMTLPDLMTLLLGQST